MKLKNNRITRRDFVKLSSLTGAGLLVSPYLIGSSSLSAQDKPKPGTNIADALKHARTELSMPGKYPGKVIRVDHANSVVEQKISATAAYDMIAKGMLALTGAATLKEAWRQFVSDNDRIGLKVNPVAGPTLSTSIEVTSAIVKQLEEAGISKKNLLIWDRREFEMTECGFNETNFPGIKIIGTERKDDKGSFYDTTGKLHSEAMIDKNWYYWADCEDKYDAETLPYMVNEGKHSYFTKIVTEMCDKIINIPILKNAGSSVTLCMKNLAYGAVTNTARLHKQLWSDTSAEVCAFPPLRDKVVLNIVDGIKGCYNGGPGANPQFFFDYKTILLGTDPVAVDRIGYQIVIKKRMDENLQKEETKRGKEFLEMAQNLKLGTADLNAIQLQTISMS